MCEAFDDHEGSVGIGGRLITNFRIADDIAVNAKEEEEAGALVDRLDITTTRYKMEIRIRIKIVYWWNAETTVTHQDLWLGN